MHLPEEMFQGVHVYPKQPSQNRVKMGYIWSHQKQRSGIEGYIIFLKYISKRLIGKMPINHC